MRELLLEIWTSVQRNKLRTFLTGFSVAWGIFMLVILLGSGNGLQNGVRSNFGNYTTNSIELYGGFTSIPYKGYDKWRRIKLRNSDLQILLREFPEVKQVAARKWLQDQVITYQNQFTDASLQGCMPEIAQINGIELKSGRFINNSDMENNRKTVVVDEGVQKVLFKGEDPMGKTITMGGKAFTVVGVTKGDAMRTQAVCYIPLSTAQLIYSANNPEVSNAILVLNDIETDEQMKQLEARILKRLSSEHLFSPEDKNAIWINNNMESYKNFTMVFYAINLFVWIIGLGTLLAGVVGVSNIMLVTVSERTSEFGVRKALGAKPGSIIRLILAESVLITAMFGYIGMVLGVATMEVVNYYIKNQATMVNSTDGFSPTIFLNPTLNLSVAASATVVLVIAGLIAGYIPARRAAKLKTIDALRYNK